MKRIRRIMMALLICFVIGAICPESTLQISNPVEVQAATTVATPKLVSAKPSGTTKAVIKWGAVKGASGYRIYRSTNAKNWKTLKTISGASKVTYTDSKLKSGSRYYYTVRAYKKVKGKTVWSSYNKKGISVIAGLQYLKLNKSSISLYEGKSYTLKINGTSLKPSWKSSNTKVATVNSSGKVVAKKKGTTTITATIDNTIFKCKVSVKENNTTINSNNLVMAAIGIQAAYDSAKFPSSLHIKSISYEKSLINGYGDNISRLVVEAYAKNSFGGYGYIYSVVICSKTKEFYPDAFKYNGYYYTTSSFTHSPYMSGVKVNNKDAVNMWKKIYNKSIEIPYD